MTHWSTGVSSYVKRAPHRTHFWSQKEGLCAAKLFYWVPLYRIRSFHASFHHFPQSFYICEVTTKASNENNALNFIGAWFSVLKNSVPNSVCFFSKSRRPKGQWFPVSFKICLDKDGCTSLPALVVLCLVVISKWPPLSHRCGFSE